MCCIGILSWLASLSLKEKRKYEKEELLLKVGVTTARNLVLYFSTETLN